MSGMPLTQLLREPRLRMIFLLGICSGFPWVLIGSAMTGWLTDAGLSRTSIGLFGSIFFVYAINFLWAPVVDGFRLPVFRRLGDRKSWIVFLLLVMTLACWGISQISPQASMVWLSILAMTIALASATCDIAIDGFRVDSFDPEAEAELIPYAAAFATSGWWTGYSLLGAAAFYMKGLSSMVWADVFFYLALFCLFITAMVAILVERDSRRREKLESRVAGLSLRAQLRFTLIEPFRALLSRYGSTIVLLLLSFLFTFKMGEAFLGRMSITFYKEIGFTDAQIATYSKMVTWWVTIVFSLIGAYFNQKLGIFRGLLIGGLAMAGTNLLFAWIAVSGPLESLYLFAVIADGFTSAFATVVLVSFVTLLTDRVFSATQYALLASIANFGRTTVSGASGYVVDYLNGDWATFFVLTTLMVLPSLVILWWLIRLLQARNFISRD